MAELELPNEMFELRKRKVAPGSLPLTDVDLTQNILCLNKNILSAYNEKNSSNYTSFEQIPLDGNEVKSIAFGLFYQHLSKDQFYSMPADVIKNNLTNVLEGNYSATTCRLMSASKVALIALYLKIDIEKIIFNTNDKELIAKYLAYYYDYLSRDEHVYLKERLRKTQNITKFITKRIRPFYSTGEMGSTLGITRQGVYYLYKQNHIPSNQKLLIGVARMGKVEPYKLLVFDNMNIDELKALAFKKKAKYSTKKS